MKLFRARENDKTVVFFSEKARRAWVSQVPECRRPIHWSEARRKPRIRVARFTR